MGKHYFVANYSVTRAEGLPAEYVERVNPMLAGLAGAYGSGEVLEGSPEDRVVVIEFDSRDEFDAWYFSDEYQEVLPLRTDNSEGWAVVIEAG
jgi:uncharacterized protein (DUF1330 family)